jgi:acetylornithine/N-succinyldiaminopimelate aminotransferase
MLLRGNRFARAKDVLPVITPLLPTYARADLAFDRGEGPLHLFDQRRAVPRFRRRHRGQRARPCHPQLVAALTEQAGKLWHTSNLYPRAGAGALAKRLVAATFADTVFFTNSGAEAIECAIKMARAISSSSGHPERFRIITFEGAFHGRTLATHRRRRQAKYLEGFGPKVEGFDQVPFGDLKAVEAAIGPETARS